MEEGELLGELTDRAWGKHRSDSCTRLEKFVLAWPTRRLNPNSHGIQPKSDGLQPNCHGLQPNCHGLQPNSDGLQPISEWPPT